MRTKAESGELKNFVAGKYESYGKVDILMYRERNVSELVPGTSVRGKMAGHMLSEPELVKGVEFMAKAVGTASADTFGTERADLTDLDPQPRGKAGRADLR